MRPDTRDGTSMQIWPETITVLSRKASAFLGREYEGYEAFFLLFLRCCHKLARPQKGPMSGQPKSKASSLSSAEVGRLWQLTGPKPGSVGILAL
jgi:hypothetical protein